MRRELRCSLYQLLNDVCFSHLMTGKIVHPSKEKKKTYNYIM